MSITILIIDDEPRVLRAFARNVRLGGYTVFTAEGGRAGLELYHQERPEIVITDLRMPDPSGQQVLEAIRAHDPEANVILVSGHGDQDAILKALRAGASDFLPKPVDQVTLESALRRAVERVHLKRELRASREALREQNARLEEEVARRTAELRQTTRRFQALLDHSPALVHIFDEEGRYLLVGEATAKALELPREEIIGKTFADLLPPETVATFMRRVETLKESRAELFVEDQITVNGEEQFFESLLFPLSEEHGVSIYAAIATDVTERRRAEDALRESEERFRMTVHLSPIGVGIVDSEGNMIDCNAALAEMVGYSREELLRLSFKDFTHPDDLEREWQLISKLWAEETTEYRMEKRYLHRDGHIVWVDVAASLFKDETGKLAFGFAFVQDITERKRVKEEIESERAFLSTVLENIAEAIIICDAEGRIVRFNEAARQLHGVPEDPIPPEKWGAYYNLYQADGVAPLPTEEIPLFRALQGEHVQNAEIVVNPEHSAPHSLVCSGQALTDAVGEITGAVVTMHDITARKRMEAALRESERRYRQLFDAAPISIWEEDFSAVKHRLDALPLQDIPDLRAYFIERPALVQELAALVQVVDVNQATLKLYHAESKEVFFAGIGQVFSPESYEDFIGALLVIAEGGIALETEKTHRTLDGQILHIQLHWAVAPGYEDSYARVLVNIVDVTPRKRMEAALRESESRVKHKLKSILSPAGDLSSLDLVDIIDVEAIQSLMDHFYALTHIGIAIVDMEGEVLVATGWQDICTKFHRVHPETRQYCIASDTALSTGITPGDYKLYKCKNNMWDMATPIVVGGRHVGNLFLGQFFFDDETIDREAFRKQAEAYGFDEAAYLTALDRVPRWPREKVRTVFRFYTELATLISQLSHSNLNLAQSLAEKKRLIAELRKSEQTFKSYIEHAPYGVFVADEQGRYVEVNAAACQMTGYERDELLNMQLVHLTPPEHREAAKEHFRTVVAEGGATGVAPFIRKDGTLRWWSVVAVRLTDTRFLGYTEDITARKQAEEALRVSEQEKSLILDGIGDLIAYHDKNMRLVRGNQAYLSGIKMITGEPAQIEDIRGLHCYEAWGLTKPCIDCPVRIAIETGKTSEAELTPENQPHWPATQGSWLVKASPVHDAQDNLIGAIEISHNITERKQAEEEQARLTTEVRTQANQMAQILATAPAGMLLLDATGRVQQANTVAERDLAVLAGVAVGDTLTRLGDRLLAELLTSPPIKGLWHEIKADDRTFEILARPVENGPEPEQWVLVINDVTEERQIRAQIQQQAQLAAVGQLAAGIAHDFNNIMAVIVLYTKMGLNTPDVPPQLRARLEVVSQQARRATDLIQQILDFGRRAVLKRQPMDLVSFLKEVVKLLERTLPENIKVKLSFDQDDYIVNADPTRIQQAIMNLAINARDAMRPQGSGELRIDLSRMATPDEVRCVTCGQALGGDNEDNGDNGEWVRIAVTDNGSGIPPEALPHIFEPFFTTKEVGQGTGLGLSQVFGIVKQHEGHIDVTSQVGRGTTFIIYLPALQVRPSTPPAIERKSLIRGQGETVLVVEDNAALRAAMIDILELLNYRGLPAANGRAALAVLEQHADEIAVVLSDLVMPEMGGQALFHAMRQRGLTLPVVMLSGHPMEHELEVLQAQGLAGWMLKPLDGDQLAQLLAQVLGKE